MQTVTTIGLDIAKSVFQVHGVDAAGQVLIRRQLKRRAVLAFFEKLPVCLVGIEACASSHHWSRLGWRHQRNWQDDAFSKKCALTSPANGTGFDIGGVPPPVLS
jgi:hypothetical protein